MVRCLQAASVITSQLIFTFFSMALYHSLREEQASCSIGHSEGVFFGPLGEQRDGPSRQAGAWLTIPEQDLSFGGWFSRGRMGLLLQMLISRVAVRKSKSSRTP